MLRRPFFFLGMIGALGLSLGTSAAGASFESKPTRTHLLELYTSEGCSSCPPAEAWLSRLKNEAQLWRDFVPVSFHVDYWDRLGWRDPFASKSWTARQYEYSARWKSSSVYTPGFILDGREWRNRGIPGPATDMPGVLKLSVLDSENVSVNFSPPLGDSRKFEVHVARLGFDLSVNVKAGENNGRKLRHDFVVLSLADGSLNSGSTELRLGATPPRQAEGSRAAIAAWITESGQIEPIQAVGGWLE